MGVADRIAELAAKLPPAKQAEVLDFVEFLTKRAATAGRVGDWSDAGFGDVALAALVDDDDPVTYELSDCRETR